MKSAGRKSTPPVIVPVDAKGLRKDYSLAPSQAKKALSKLEGLHAKRKAAGKVTRVKGRFHPGLFD